MNLPKKKKNGENARAGRAKRGHRAVRANQAVVLLIKYSSLLIFRSPFQLPP